MFRTIAEVGIGLLFMIGAIFNIGYTLRHGEEFYESFAKNAWFPPSAHLMRRLVITQATLVTVLLIVVQVTIAALILSRGDFVEIGLILGCLFSLTAAFVSSIGGAIGNLALAVLMAILTFSQ